MTSHYGFPEMGCVIPPGRVGIASIKHQDVTEVSCGKLGYTAGDVGAVNVVLSMNLGPGEDPITMMSDAPCERETCCEAVAQARGNVLIAGLGLGMILHPILAKPEVRTVTVVEKYPDVISLVGPTVHAGAGRLSIIEADIREWNPGSRLYDAIWFDIWPTWGALNIPEMCDLHQRFRRSLALGGWMGSWMWRESCAQLEWAPDPELRSWRGAIEALLVGALPRHAQSQREETGRAMLRTHAMFTTPRNPRPPAAISQHSYAFFQNLARRESGIVIGEGEQGFLADRLLPIARSLRLPSLNDLYALLQASPDPSLQQRVVDAMLLHETLFFREPTQFDALRSSVLPELVRERQACRRIRAWSAGASTGQEAYSLAMVFLEMGLGDWDIEIVGTDLSASVLQRAAAGLYRETEVLRGGLPTHLLTKYFQRAGPDFQIKDEVRRLVRFEQDDLRKCRLAMEPFDLVLCRNVLLYFDRETKLDVLESIRKNLSLRGFLLLSGGETLSSTDGGFYPQRTEDTVFWTPAPPPPGDARWSCLDEVNEG